MKEYLSIAEIAVRWNVSTRWVRNLCVQERITGAKKVGATWIIPADVEKPKDERVKSGKYKKTERVSEDSQ